MDFLRYVKSKTVAAYEYAGILYLPVANPSPFVVLILFSLPGLMFNLK